VIHFEDLPDVLTRKELQTYLRLGRNATYDLLNNGTIPSVRVNQKFLIPKRGVRDFLTQATESVGTGTPVKGKT
jgi:excisionase family DNA binding protein